MAQEKGQEVKGLERKRQEDESKGKEEESKGREVKFEAGEENQTQFCKSLKSDSSLEAIMGQDKATKLWRDSSRT